jgi:hypothetical protein
MLPADIPPSGALQNHGEALHIRSRNVKEASGPKNTSNIAQQRPRAGDVLDDIIQANDVEGVRPVRRIGEITIENVVTAGCNGGGRRGNLQTTYFPANGLRRI